MIKRERIEDLCQKGKRNFALKALALSVKRYTGELPWNVYIRFGWHLHVRACMCMQTKSYCYFLYYERIASEPAVCGGQMRASFHVAT